MSSFRGGRGSSRGRAISTFGQSGATAPGSAPSASSTTTTGSGHDARTQRPGFGPSNGRGRGSNQLRLNGTSRGGAGAGAVAGAGAGAGARAGGGSGTKTHQPGGRGGRGGRGRGAISATFTPRTKDGNEDAGILTRIGDGASYPDRFQALKKKRERERADAIAQGFLADPDKPRTLAHAITPVGTCPDMCAEFERVERVVQKDVWLPETEPGSEDGTAAEHRMVKKFRRAAAGLDEQLPSDLRPPPVLKKTVDYLFNTIIGGAESLAAVHHFVWDRTRAIRNDFSIQQTTKLPDLEIAIESYERIARFHILSLHQLASPEKPYDKYDWYQELEQLDRTLLSLMQYYDDVKGRLACPNEPEFRAYLVIFQAQNPNPDMEERVNEWDTRVRSDLRIRKALDLYSAASNILDSQGPLKPYAIYPVAQEDWSRFFTLVQSNATSYLMACVSEIYFNLMRRATLNAIWCAFRPQSAKHDVADFTVDLMTELFGFDDDEQTEQFCQQLGFVFKEPQDGEPFLDLKSVTGNVFPKLPKEMPHQTFSDRLVESKRAGRTLPAIINGLSVLDAQQQGLVDEVTQNDYHMEEEDENSLFVPEGPATKVGLQVEPVSSGNNGSHHTTDSGTSIQGAKTWSFSQLANPTASSPSTVNGTGSLAPASSFPSFSKFGQPSTAAAPEPATPKQPTPSPFAFGQPSTAQQTPFASPAVGTTPKPSIFSQASAPIPQSMDGATQPGRLFDFTKASIPPIITSGGVPASTPPSSFAPQPKAPTFNDTFSQQTPSAASPFAAKPAEPTLPASSGIFSPSSWASPSKSTSTSETNTGPEIAVPSVFQPSTETSPAPPSTIIDTSRKPSLFQGLSTQQPMQNSATGTTPVFQAFNLQSPTESGTPSKSVETKESQAPLPPASNTSFEPIIPAASASSNYAPASILTKSDEPQKPLAPNATSNTAAKASLSPTAPSKPSFASTAQPNQPKKPSPLSQSFSATEDGVDLGRLNGKQTSVSASGKFSDPLPEASLGSRSTASSFTSTVADTPPVKLPSKDDILQRLAREVILDVDTGFIRQYVEFHARQTILEIYDQLYMESLQQLADNFRKETLALRYGRKWRDICWRRRLVRQGRERRKRVKKEQSAKEIGKKLAAETNAVDTFLKSMQGNKTNVNHHSLNGQAKPTPSKSLPTTQPVSRTTLSNGRPEGPAQSSPSKGSQFNGSRQADHVDPSGRVSKPHSALSHQNTPSRPSYLSFSTQRGSQSIGNPQNTPARSNYFRLRAMGINPNGSAGATPLGRKRSREDSEEAVLEISPIARKSRTPPYPITSGRADNGHNDSISEHRRSICRATDRSRSQAQEEDEVLFARARAARQALSDSAAWYRSEIQKDDNQRNQLMASSLQSASMQRAREAVRLRSSETAHSLRGSIAGLESTPRVPAYRFRESRFVPRGQYGKAIERAKEKLETRSQTPVQPDLQQRRGGVGPSEPLVSRLSFEKTENAVATPGSHPLQNSQPDNDNQSSFLVHGHIDPFSAVPASLDFSQTTAVPCDYTAGDESAVAEALYRTMMQSTQQNPGFADPDGSVVPDSFGNHIAPNGVNDEQALAEPSLQDWVNDDDGMESRNGDDAHMEQYDEEDVEEEEEEEEHEFEHGYYDDEEEEELYDEEDDEDDEEPEETDDEEARYDVPPQYHPQPQYKQAEKYDIGPSSIVKGSGTQDDAFELSD